MIHPTFLALALWSLAVSSDASSIFPQDRTLDSDALATLASLYVRAQPNAPNGYTPVIEDCPSVRPSIRSASALSPNETSWLQLRRNKTVEPMRDLLRRVNITGFDAAAYISNHANNATALPNIAIAFSGGGYRALMNGGGALQAFDSREENSTTAGHLGGLLQASTYVAGLSGGGWLVGSIFVNNFTTISNLLHNQNRSSVWEFENSIFEGPATGGFQVLSSAKYFDEIYDAVSKKADPARFQTTITDYWGRALSYQLVNATDGGPGYTWSSIASDDDFARGNAPMPLLVADGRAPGELLISGNATVFEFNPWEFGTFDPTDYGFAPLKYLGSNFSNGILPPGQGCVHGFDNVGYIMGTSSSLFNQGLFLVDDQNIPTLAKNFLKKILKDIGQGNNDIADYSPNPFYGYHNSTSPNSQSQRLTLVDGGEDLQNIPLHPLIQPSRHVDVIFAVDSSADTSNWPNGTALVATYQRSLTKLNNGTSFPAIPDQNTFVNLGLNTHPTFFGCNSSNTTGATPLVVYIPNSPYVYQSNVTTYDPKYNTSDRNAIVHNGYEVATMGNATIDPLWPTCVGCAILSRSLERTETNVPDVCLQCFRKYCWDGTVNSTTPSLYNPKYVLQRTYTNSSANTKKSGTSGKNDILYSVFGSMLTILAIILAMSI